MAAFSEEEDDPLKTADGRLGRLVMSAFLRSARAYDILPESNKVVVFDVAVPVKLAFYALVEHGRWTERPSYIVAAGYSLVRF